MTVEALMMTTPNRFSSAIIRIYPAFAVDLPARSRRPGHELLATPQRRDPRSSEL